MTAWSEPGNDVADLVRLFQRIERVLDPIPAVVTALTDRRIDVMARDLLTANTIELTDDEIEQVRAQIRTELFTILDGLNNARGAAGALAGLLQDEVAERVREGRRQIKATQGLATGLAVAD